MQENKNQRRRIFTRERKYPQREKYYSHDKKQKKIGFRDFLNIKEIITIDKTINILHSMQIIDLTRKTRNKLCSRA